MTHCIICLCNVHVLTLSQESTEPLYNNNKVKDLGNLYDPCFLLPLFSAILRPGIIFHWLSSLSIISFNYHFLYLLRISSSLTECVIDCLKFVSSHALGVTVMALSSYDPKVRAAAYHVLSCFYQHLEGAQFREKRQVNIRDILCVCVCVCVNVVCLETLTGLFLSHSCST